MTEFETRILNIDVDDIITKLISAGATKVKDYFYKRFTYDYPDLQDDIAWFRLRTDGYEHTLTYKAKKSDAIDGVEELESKIENFDTLHEMLLRLKPTRVIYYENKRTKYQLEDTEFCIDTWPLAPTWLEIESDSEAKVRTGLKLLDLEGQDVGNVTVWQTFQQYYNIDLNEYETFTFDKQNRRSIPNL